ncbi:MAG: cyclic nucleotide-binding domain-containing protein [Fibrobacter sp.]|nr:cyclic nucleotide-binding domain-containing protein [Fibrobacter sp.]
MKTVDSRQHIIPPNRINVKAGFVVYTPNSDERSIVILNDGELAARNKDNPNEIVFTMEPGDLVGVAALLEREPFHHELVATKDSTITIVNEECMESELQRLPVWLLAVIKTLSAKTRKMKYAARQSNVVNSLKSLAEYCSHKPAKEPLYLTEMIQEYGWLTRIPNEVIQEDFKSLVRRHLMQLTKVDGRVICRIPDPDLLKIFIDYLTSVERCEPFAPYKLTLYQKKVLALLSTMDGDTKKDSPGWLNFIKQNDPKAGVGEWICLVKLGWFKPVDNDSFVTCTDKVMYFLKALRYETNIRGVV